MISTNDFYWSVAVTKPQAEAQALASIERAGFCAWLPMYERRKILKGARVMDGRRIRSRADTVVVERCPLFRRYLFVQVPHGEGGYEIDRAAGVVGLLRHPNTEEQWGNPKAIRARLIVQLQEWAESGLVEDERGNVVSRAQVAKVRDDLKLGDRVRTPTGIVGQLVHLDERGRADLLADILGGTSIRGVDAKTLELICA